MAKQKTGMVWLRARMTRLGYHSLQEVAEDLDINRGNLYRYFSLETKPSVAMLPKLSKVLDATYAEILKALECI